MGKFSYGDAWDTPTRVPVTAVIPLTDDYPFTNIVGAWTHIFSPAIVNNARAGLTRIKLNASIPKDLSGLFGNDGETTAGIALSPGWTQTQPGYAYMNLAVGDLQNFGSEPPIQGFAVDNNFDSCAISRTTSAPAIPAARWDNSPTTAMSQQTGTRLSKTTRATHSPSFFWMRHPTPRFPAFMARSDSGSGGMLSLFRMTGR
jgi:hypothetical protein